MRTLLVADLHLSSDTPELNQGFYRYLEQTAPALMPSTFWAISLTPG